MPGSQKRVSESVSDGANLFSFSQFSCEKLKRFAPSKAVPGILDGVTTRSYVFLLSIFFLSVYYYIDNWSKHHPMSGNTIKLMLAIWKRVSFYSYKSKDRYIISVPLAATTAFPPTFRDDRRRGVVDVDCLLFPCLHCWRGHQLDSLQCRCHPSLPLLPHRCPPPRLWLLPCCLPPFVEAAWVTCASSITNPNMADIKQILNWKNRPEHC